MYGAQTCVPDGRCAMYFREYDGRQDSGVTGVHACALQIQGRPAPRAERAGLVASERVRPDPLGSYCLPEPARSEERRVGKECRYRWTAYQLKKNSSEKSRNNPQLGQTDIDVERELQYQPCI